MSNYSVPTIVILAALVGRMASAQEPPDTIMFGAMQAAPLPAPPTTMMWKQPFGLLAVEPLEMGEPVENAPYSAEIVTEVTQELADGNRIERRTTSTVARDGRGRVRREQQVAAIGPVLPDGDMRIVTISDPVARVHYSLNPERKAAIRTRPPAGMRAPGLPPPPFPPPPPPPNAEGEAGAVTFHRHVDAPSTSDARTEKLGTRDFEGVPAEGTRTTTTFPAGAIGNVRPIDVVSERWYSPELRVVVFSRRSDPRFGDTTYRLTNIVRAEPDASLFQVPADYSTEEMKLPPFERAKRKIPVKPPM
jgi:hypothetical protein